MLLDADRTLNRPGSPAVMGRAGMHLPHNERDERMTEKTEIRLITTGITNDREWTSSSDELNGMEQAQEHLERQRARIGMLPAPWQPRVLSAHLETRAVSEWQTVPASEVVSS